MTGRQDSCPKNSLSIAVGVVFVSALMPTIALFSSEPQKTSIQRYHPRIIYLYARDLQTVIDGAPPHSIVVCDPNRLITFTSTAIIHKPLTLIGLNACLPKSLGNTPLLAITAEDVKVSNFRLRGNMESVSQEQRASLIVVKADNFIIENGLVIHSARHGVLVSARQKEGDICTGVVRNIVGRGNGRDVVSIEGHGGAGFVVRNVLVEDIQGYESRFRGAVEVCDGAENVTVRNIYADTCIYGVDVQDHGRDGQINRDITIARVRVKNCSSAVRTWNTRRGHRNLTVCDVTSVDWRIDDPWRPIYLTNTANVVVHNIRIRENRRSPAVLIRNCDGLSVRDVTIENSRHGGAAVLVEDCNGALIDGLVLRGQTQSLTCGILYRVSSNRTFRNLRICNVVAQSVKSAGIELQNRSQGGTLDFYVIAGNIARVADHIKGQHTFITDNLPQTP